MRDIVSVKAMSSSERLRNYCKLPQLSSGEYMDNYIGGWHLPTPKTQPEIITYSVLTSLHYMQTHSTVHLSSHALLLTSS